MKNVKIIISEELNKRYNLIESFNKIKLTEDKNLQFNMVIGKFGQLIDEGYNEHQIDNIIEEQLGDFVKGLFNTNQTQKNNSQNLGTTALSAGSSQFQEWIIGKFLEMLGFKGELANVVSTTLSEIGFFELINLIRGKYNCQKTSLMLVNSLGEGIVRLIINKGFKSNGLLTNYVRNFLMQYLKSEGYTRKLANVICQIIEKNKPSLQKAISLF